MAEFHATYEYSFDPDDPSDTAATVSRIARAGGNRVLDLGCGPGIVASFLQNECGKHVTGLDGDASRLEAARARGVQRTVLADLDAPDWRRELADEQFDVIILADVLEHLRRPQDVLNALHEQGLLATGGFIVVSIPNGTHTGVIAELVAGCLTYREAGLLDSTHIHFFSRESFESLCGSCGFAVTSLHRISRTLDATEMFGRFPETPLNFVRELERTHPEASTYQFVMKLERTRVRAGSLGTR